MNIQNMMQMIQAVQNPQQLLQKMGIPQECMNSPQSVVQYLLDNGKVTQQQMEQVSNMYKMFKR